METADVIIIGAGAAGLSCAKKIQQGGLKVKILEARDRIGGRAFTLKAPHFDQPPEFGAEFIHGAPPILLDILQESGQSFVDVSDCHMFYDGGTLKREPDFWDRLETLTKRLNGERKTDRSVAEFLQAHGKKTPKELQKIFKAYVEGFQAADLNTMGEKSLAHIEHEDEGSLNKSELFRPARGYSTVLESFLQDKALAEAIHLQCLVRKLEWQPGKVTIQVLEKGKRRTYIAPKVVITVPVGVLKSKDLAASFQITPQIPELSEALAVLQMGHVQRITFQFDHRFWESLSEEKTSFFHTGPENYFPAWWTQMPTRSSLLVAWQGGPKAAELGQKPVAERVRLALKTLAKISGHSPAFLNKHMVAYFTHNWSEDPYSLGAYSYTGVQNGDALKALHKGIRQTLWFAGEALAPGAQQGTVHGAMGSGQKAAEQILKADWDKFPVSPYRQDNLSRSMNVKGF